MHRIFFPNTMWLVLIIWVLPALPGLGLGVIVLVSARAQGFQDASQLGSMVVLPVVLLVFGQVSGVMVFSVGLVLLMGLVIWLLDGLLIYLGSHSFHRNRLLAAWSFMSMLIDDAGISIKTKLLSYERRVNHAYAS